MAPVRGTKSRGFLGVTVPPHENYRYLLLNNTGITLKPKFYFITLKFVTKGVCGYLDGPCCLLTTTGAAQRNAQSTVQPQHPSPQNPKNFKVDFRKKYGSYGALDRPKFLRKLCSFVRSYLRPWGPKTLGSEKSMNPPNAQGKALAG